MQSEKRSRTLRAKARLCEDGPLVLTHDPLVSSHAVGEKQDTVTELLFLHTAWL